MKMLKFSTMYIMILVVTLTVNAGTTLTKSLQLPIYDDILKKKQIEYKDPGRTGTDVLWDFSKLKILNSRYKVQYYRPIISQEGDSSLITSVEHRTMYNYQIKGDSLLLLGYENPNSRLTYSIPQYVLHFPFTYRDSITSLYGGEGVFEHTLSSRTNGRLTVVADAIGTLILPDGDTISNALRVRSVCELMQRTKKLENKKFVQTSSRKRTDSTMIPKNFINQNLQRSDTSNVYSNTAQNESMNNLNGFADVIKQQKKDSGRRKSNIDGVSGEDSLVFLTETCRWYAPGYRYPLFETIRNVGNRSITDTTKMKDFATAFIFPPIMQDSLENDPKNKAIRDSILRDNNQDQFSDELLFHYNLYPNPVRTNLTVELLLDKTSRVGFELSNLPGNPLIRHDYGILNAGSHTLNLPMSSLRTGNYALRIQVGQQAVRIVILKK